MKQLFCLLLLCAASSADAAFTEFYCISGGGANTNSGSSTSATATYSSVNGNWNGTSVFTPVDGSTPASTVNVGDFAAVYVDGNTNATYVARVNTVAAGANGAITLSVNAAAGTAPSSSSTGRTISVGGAWGGPTLIGDGFPFSFVSGSLTNTSGNSPRVNCKGTWFSTNGITDAVNLGPVWFQGYTNTIGDGGFCNIYGSNNISGYALFTISGKNRNYANFIWATNGNSGSQHLVSLTTGECLIYNCAAHDARLAGFFMSTPNTFNTLEAWNCDQANNSAYGAIMSQAAGCIMLNCFAHDNAGANVAGFETDGTQTAIGCIAANNGGDGFRGTGDVQLTYLRCEAFNNGGNGINMAGSSGTINPVDPMCINFINCNFIKNGKCGITNSAASQAYYNGLIVNCGFGSGTMTNPSGDIEGRLQGVQTVNCFDYPANSFPYFATNNFTIALSQAKNKGTNFWLNVSPMNYATTVGYPDVGSAQHLDTGGTSNGSGSYPFSQ